MNVKRGISKHLKGRLRPFDVGNIKISVPQYPHINVLSGSSGILDIMLYQNVCPSDVMFCVFQTTLLRNIFHVFDYVRLAVFRKPIE